MSEINMDECIEQIRLFKREVEYLRMAFDYYEPYEDEETE